MEQLTFGTILAVISFFQLRWKLTDSFFNRLVIKYTSIVFLLYLFIYFTVFTYRFPLLYFYQLIALKNPLWRVRIKLMYCIVIMCADNDDVL